MCGIFGMALRAGAGLKYDEVTYGLSELYRLSESRGKESAGLHVYRPAPGEAWTLKGAERATALLKSQKYAKLIEASLKPVFTDNGSDHSGEPLAILAHSRLVTNGVAERVDNNQPVRWGGVTVIHNGIIVNVDDLWGQHANLKRTADVDTEVLAAIISDKLDTGLSATDATKEAFGEIRGAASIAWLHENGQFLVLATNTGDLFRYLDPKSGYVIFASERYILSEVLKKMEIAEGDGNGAGPAIEWLSPGEGVGIDLNDLSVHPFQFGLALGAGNGASETANGAVNGFGLGERSAVQHDMSSGAAEAPAVSRSTADESLLRYGEANLAELKRCSKCVLPETFPYIEFDDKGECNYCRGYKPRYKGMDPEGSRRDFIESLAHYRRDGHQPDTIVAFSGGRDSCYGLHLIKKEFGLTPITFTYDWGMVTDLARRNIARICGQLGIQNVLVSADIKEKRANIRKNVSAWLKKPDLGMVPLFMAGDKAFFSVVNDLKRQTGIKLDLWCANPLENTDFKSGFCGVSPDFDKKRVDYLSLGRKAKMASYYGTRFLMNPGYINTSLVDTARAFSAYYFEPRRDFYFIFDHFVWNEDEVNRVLLGEYDWETSPDTPSTWRIGDGTAPFYNYIYLTANGFSEFDTFRSNQIREGMISREDALKNVLIENRPRVPSLKWYLETVGLDFNDTIRRINELDTRGLHR